jgi:uncharacterized membrane protein YfcA
VATATAVALFVDGARLPVYLATQGDAIARVWPLVSAATIGVVIGTALGMRVLRQIPEPLFRKGIAVVLILLGAYMVLVAHD